MTLADHTSSRLAVLLVERESLSDALIARLQSRGCEVTTAREKSEVARQLRGRRWDAVLVNPALIPQYGCVELVTRMRRLASPTTAIVVLTADGTLERCRGCKVFAQNHIDCLDRPCDEEEIVSRLLTLVRQTHPSPPLPPVHGLLTPREQEVLRFLREGLTNREIAQRLYVVEKVVEKHISSVCHKLEVPNRAAAVGLSYRRIVM